MNNTKSKSLTNIQNVGGSAQTQNRHLSTMSKAMNIVTNGNEGGRVSSAIERCYGVPKKNQASQLTFHPRQVLAVGQQPPGVTSGPTGQAGNKARKLNKVRPITTAHNHMNSTVRQ